MVRRFFVWGFTLALAGIVGLAGSVPAYAQDASDFSLQVTPSPLVTTVKPGVTTELELNIRNAGTGVENLKIEPRSFTIDPETEQVKVSDTPPAEISDWISFSKPTFTIQPGAWFVQKVKLSLPKDAGFSYSFSLVISRVSNPQVTSGRALKGSLAIFTLVNVDRPGATRKIDIGQFISTKRVYEYLPAELSMKIRNTGNTIVQPYGNIFIQRNSNSKQPIATLEVNDTKAYLLPGTARTLTSDWNNGFPVYKVIQNSDGTQTNKLTWNWASLSNLRIGRYTAKLVAVYNDGQRDVPLESELTFWVIPWKILLGLFVVLLLVLFGVWSFIRRLTKLFGHGKKPKASSPPAPKA